MAIDLALDLGGSTGWAIRYEGGAVRCGAWRLTRGQVGGSRSIVPHVRLWKRLCRLGWDYDVRSVIIEEAFARGAAGWRLTGLQTLVMFWSHTGGVPWQRVPPNLWKKICCGSGNIDKAAYFGLARKTWPDLRIVNDDAAAALWLLHYEERTSDAG